MRLTFGPTDYFTQKVTDLNIGHPTRERYARRTDITDRPIPEFASILGVNLNLITKDGYLIVTGPSEEREVAGGTLHTSVGENLLRPIDQGVNNAPDPFRCAFRGAQEELGVELKPGKVEFTAFGVYPRYCQYSLIGWSEIDETQVEIERLYSLGIPKDKWENSKLYFIPCKPEEIANFVVSRWDKWFPIGLAAVVLSLFQQGFSPREVDNAFSRARSKYGV